MKLIADNIGKLTILFLISFTITIYIFVGLVKKEINDYSSAKELCIKNYNTDDYRLLNGNTYCKVDGEFIQAAKKKQG